jgi:hypothetical protein
VRVSTATRPKPLRGVWTGQGGRWQRYDRMRGAGPTMAHFNGTDFYGYFAGAVCGYDPHRGLPRPSAVLQVEGDEPRCSRCERILSRRPF